MKKTMQQIREENRILDAKAAKIEKLLPKGWKAQQVLNLAVFGGKDTEYILVSPVFEKGIKLTKEQREENHKEAQTIALTLGIPKSQYTVTAGSIYITPEAIKL